MSKFSKETGKSLSERPNGFPAPSSGVQKVVSGGCANLAIHGQSHFVAGLAISSVVKSLTGKCLGGPFQFFPEIGLGALGDLVSLTPMAPEAQPLVGPVLRQKADEALLSFEFRCRPS